jgi:3',5'-cyclic AMP phosphodiesterase CpdA
MKMLVLSDLHLDEILDRAYLNHIGTAIHEAGQEADALIIAGDLTEAAAQKWPDALRWLGTLYPAAKTVVIPGNHDYYGGNLGSLDAQLDQICHAAGCAFGQGRILVLGHVRVLMTTLWTDMRLLEAGRQNAVEDTLWNARQMMPDYGYGAITVDDPDRPLRPEDTIAVHERQKAWLVSELARPWSGRTVVVTHHAPSGAVAGEITPLSPCFASNLEDEIGRYRPNLWLFGHTHKPAEMRMPCGTRLRNVSVGYEGETSLKEMVARVRRSLIDLGQK